VIALPGRRDRTMLRFLDTGILKNYYSVDQVDTLAVTKFANDDRLYLATGETERSAQLTLSQVKEILPLLIYFVEHGDLPVPGVESHRDNIGKEGCCVTCGYPVDHFPGSAAQCPQCLFDRIPIPPASGIAAPPDRVQAERDEAAIDAVTEEPEDDGAEFHFRWRG
jgi:hypothetical protein